MTSAPPPGLGYRVRHTSEYAYAEPVSLSMHQVRLTPRASGTQIVRETRLLIDPPAIGSITRADYFGNVTTTFTIQGAHRHLRVTAESLVSASGLGRAGLDSPSLADTLVRLRARETPGELAAVEYQVESPLAPRGASYARYGAPALQPDRPLLEGVGALMETIHREFTYDPVATTVSTPVSEVLAGRHGVCQDFAHLMIACLRSHGIPARYVSGYLVPDPGVVGAQASHAWVSVYCPGHRVGGLRPHEQREAGGEPHLPGLGAGFRGRQPPERGDGRRGPPHPGGRGAGDAGGVRPAPQQFAAPRGFPAARDPTKELPPARSLRRRTAQTPGGPVGRRAEPRGDVCRATAPGPPSGAPRFWRRPEC